MNYTSKIEIALKSPAFWSIVGIFVFNGLSAVAPGLQGTPAIVVSGLLAILALVLHPGEVQKAAGLRR